MGKEQQSLTEMPQSEKSAEGLLEVAINKGADVETLERLMALREKINAEKAREAFVEALASFQEECPKLEKTKVVNNKDGTERYRYAPLDSILDAIKDHLKKHDLSYSWNMKNEESLIAATAKITHKLGHSETSEFSIPIDASAYMTAPQKYASSQTFAKRYALCNALGIYTAEEDTDATDVNDEKDAVSIKSRIMLNLRTLGHNPQQKSGKELGAIVKKLTGLALTKKNFEAINERLETFVKDQNEDSQV